MQENELDSSIFRAYDIRGVVDESLTPNVVFYLGKAIGSLARDRNVTQIAIARDGRVSGPELTKSLTEGILSVGCDVVDIGMVPTPLLYFAAQKYVQGAGIMLTGSHNPANYNGLKAILDGVALTAAEIQGLRERILNDDFYVGMGVRHDLDMTECYIKEIVDQVKLKKKLKVVIDAGNGVTGEIAPQLFRELGCDVEMLYGAIDGTFPNHHPDPSQTENLEDLIAKVKETQADVGLAFDGDGDRLGVVTNKGEIIWSDRLLMLFAKAVLQAEPGAKIIYDVKCTNHLAPMIQSLNGEPIMWKTGHSFIKAKMHATQAALAGEMSGHFFFRDRWYGFDDALYAGVRLLEILAQEERDCATVFADIPNSVNTPEIKVYVDEAEKFSLMDKLMNSVNFSDAKEIMTIDGLRINFADGWGLVRPSNTTPYLILRFEALDEVNLDQIMQNFREWMLSVKPDLAISF